MKEYKKRLIDEKLDIYLQVFGAISIEGPKWCGKTTTAEQRMKSNIRLSDPNQRENALIDLDYALNGEYPRLIDEWQLIPALWDCVRNRCDRDSLPGEYILTGSTTLDFSKNQEKENNKYNEVHHSGAGRFSILKMYPMSLYESDDSTGDVSLTDLYNNKFKTKTVPKMSLVNLCNIIIRGGWPSNLYRKTEYQYLLPKEYIEILLKEDIHQGKKKRNIDKMRKLLMSLARNESSMAGNDTLAKDIDEIENDTNSARVELNRATVAEYISVLDDLYLIQDIPAFSTNYRSSKRIAKSPKRHLIDPSISCALLNLTTEKLLNDVKTLGLMFESLVIRDLKIYIEHLNGKIFHFRDNSNGDEVDAILEFESGEYAAIEIKLSQDGINDALKSLTKFYNNVSKKPKFMCIIVGVSDAVIKDNTTGIYIFPLNALKP